MIDDIEQYDRVRKFTNAFLPRLTIGSRKYEGRRPIFDQYHIEPALRLAVSRRVPLRSGGSLVIDQARRSPRSTSTPAASPTPAQATSRTRSPPTPRSLRRGRAPAPAAQHRRHHRRRLRRHGQGRQPPQVWDAFQKRSPADRRTTKRHQDQRAGLVEMTRKRTRESLVQLLTEPCPTCEGSGVVKSSSPSLRDPREVRRSGTLVDNDKIEIECAPARRRSLVQAGARVPRSPREAVPEADHRGRPEGLEARPYRVAGKMSTDLAAEAAAEAPKNGWLQLPLRQQSAASGERRGGRRRRGRGGRGRDRAGADA